MPHRSNQYRARLAQMGCNQQPNRLTLVPPAPTDLHPANPPLPPRVSEQHSLRPGVHHLLRLLPHYRLGVFSSATRPTITKALTKLHGNLANFLAQRRQRAAAGGSSKKGKKAAAAAAAAVTAAEAGAEADAGEAAMAVAVDGEGYPSELPEVLFEVVMARDHCTPASPVRPCCGSKRRRRRLAAVLPCASCHAWLPCLAPLQPHAQQQQVHLCTPLTSPTAAPPAYKTCRRILRRGADGPGIPSSRCTSTSTPWGMCCWWTTRVRCQLAAGRGAAAGPLLGTTWV